MQAATTFPHRISAIIDGLSDISDEHDVGPHGKDEQLRRLSVSAKHLAAATTPVIHAARRLHVHEALFNELNRTRHTLRKAHAWRKADKKSLKSGSKASTMEFDFEARQPAVTRTTTKREGFQTTKTTEDSRS